MRWRRARRSWWGSIAHLGCRFGLAHGPVFLKDVFAIGWGLSDAEALNVSCGCVLTAAIVGTIMTAAVSGRNFTRLLSFHEEQTHRHRRLPLEADTTAHAGPSPPDSIGVAVGKASTRAGGGGGAKAGGAQGNRGTKAAEEGARQEPRLAWRMAGRGGQLVRLEALLASVVLLGALCGVGGRGVGTGVVLRD